MKFWTAMSLLALMTCACSIVVLAWEIGFKAGRGVGFDVSTSSDLQPREPTPVGTYQDEQGILYLPDGSIIDGTFGPREPTCTRSYNPITDVGGELCRPFPGKAPALAFYSRVDEPMKPTVDVPLTFSSGDLPFKTWATMAAGSRALVFTGFPNDAKLCVDDDQHCVTYGWFKEILRKGGVIP